MTRLSSVLATALVALILIPYVGYSLDGSWPLIEDARGMGATGLVLGAAAWVVVGARSFHPRWMGIGGALVAAALGLTATVLETGTAATVALGAFIAAIVVLWVVAVAYPWLHRGDLPSHA
jgi:hypothetical protein